MIRMPVKESTTPAGSEDVVIPIKQAVSLFDDELTYRELHPVVRNQRQNTLPRLNAI